ncbi:uncharacterized protein LOC143197959 isoform X1 [Rhynchophorus ferrugineus]|uniref:uncharacterized protein LOC143197959 isoform X1 n=1 Tax=Rhynchophorus ferrugineus TaxID=354439 RepID=UPI003FCCCBCE
MELRDKLKVVSHVAIWLGLVQSLIWLILNILCIVIYFCGDSSDSNKGLSFVQISVYYVILGNNGTDVGILKESNFIVCCYVYIVVSVIWFSICLGGFIIVKKKKSIIKYHFFIGLITTTASILDLAFFTLILVQYIQNSDADNNKNAFIKYATYVTTILMSLSRGIILWLINTIIGIYIIVISYKILRAPPILQLSSDIPRPKIEIRK